MLINKISVRICAVGEADGRYLEVIVRGGVGQYVAKPWNVVVLPSLGQQEIRLIYQESWPSSC